MIQMVYKILIKDIRYKEKALIKFNILRKRRGVPKQLTKKRINTSMK